MKFPRTNTGNLTKKELRADDSPLPFKQPTPAYTAAGPYPHRNLGAYLHKGKGKSKQVASKSPKPGRGKLVPADGDYRPRASQKSSAFAKPQTVAGLNQGQSDVNSEAIGDLMGSAPVGKPPAAFKSRKPKAKQMPFYGGA